MIVGKSEVMENLTLFMDRLCRIEFIQPLPSPLALSVFSLNHSYICCKCMDLDGVDMNAFHISLAYGRLALSSEGSMDDGESTSSISITSGSKSASIGGMVSSRPDCMILSASSANARKFSPPGPARLELEATSGLLW